MSNATAPNADKQNEDGSTFALDGAASTFVPAPPANPQLAAVPTLSSSPANPAQPVDATSMTASALLAPGISTGALQTPPPNASSPIPSNAPGSKTSASGASAKDTDPDKTSALAADAQTQAVAPPNLSALFSTQADLASQAAGETFAVPMNLTLPTASSGKGPVTPSGDKAAQKQSALSVAQTNPDFDTGATTPRNKVTVSATTDTSSHRGQDNAQSSQQSQSNMSNPPATSSAAADVAASQPQTIPTHAASHNADTQANTPSATTDTPRQSAINADTSATHLSNDGVAASSSVNTAAVLKTMAGTEMHLGMHSAEFGNISIRTSVSPLQMTTQISTDHSDLGQAISAHASSVQNKIGDDLGLRALIEVNGQTGSSSADSGGASSRDQRAMQQSFSAGAQSLPQELDVGSTPGPLLGSGDTYRLDIRA